MIKVTCAGQSAVFESPVTVSAALRALDLRDGNSALKPLGARSGGRVLALNDMIAQDCAILPITFEDEEGRRINERSLRFVLLLALHRLFPACHVRIEHSIGYGIYFDLLGETPKEDTPGKLRAEMEKIIAENLPFQPETWSRQQAIDYFAAIGENEKARLLAYRPYDYFRVYRCGGIYEYFYGTMLPGTGDVSAFNLRLWKSGMVMQLPSPKHPEIPAPFANRPKNLAAFAESCRWCDILGCANVADLNDMTVQGRLPDFIRVNEALHDKSIAGIADGILQKGAKAVFIAGPSSSGKTTFANRLCIHLRVLGLKTVLVSLDDFYRDKDTLPPAEDGKPDLEALDALDVPYLRECLTRLLAGEEALMPRYDFKTGKRRETLTPLTLESNQLLVMEGIHGLNPALHSGFDKNVIAKVYISELTCLNLDNHNRIRTTDARLLRRIVRDMLFRGTPPAETLSMWDSVRRGEEKWIFPYQEEADFLFNSALHYELPVLKRYAFEELQAIPEDSAEYPAAHRILKILNYMLPASDAVLREIPPLSLLREFIGGCTLY